MEEEEKFKPIEVTRKLFEKDYENKVCVECKCPMPSFVSINNAILLCNQCAERHMKLGYNVSYIRHITDDWDAYLYTYLDRGGNSRFIRLSKKYDLDNMPIEQKYNTRILEYYRLLIKSEVLADIPPFEIPFEVAKDPINNNVIYFPEFQNYQIYQGTFKPEKKKTSGYLDAFRYVGSGLGSMASYLANKYQEYDMNDKLIKGGALAAKGIAAAGNLLYKIAKPVVKYASIRTVQGVGYLCKQAEYQLSDDENDDEEEEEEEKDEIKRPWLKDFFYEIGTTRKVLQSIAVSLIYGFAIWGLILQIIDGVSYGLIDVGILIIFGTIMLIITIKKRSTGGCKMGILTIAVIFVGGAPTMVNFFFVESTRKLLPFFLTKSLALMFLITPLNFNE